MEGQLQSVPKILTKLVIMTLEGGEPDLNLSQSLWKVPTRISHIIHYNSVKQNRREEIKHLQPSKNKEPLLQALVGLMVHAKTGKCKLIDRLANEGMSMSYDRVIQILWSYQVKYASSTTKTILLVCQNFKKICLQLLPPIIWIII